ncbi:MAG: peptide transporter [Methanobacterium sp.]|uniref:STT3 domain-containing protein n=1 Tax=Methanobacterium sp. TaxID=2164 RepID=UPI003D661541|nr:peptide transporter [Methanobacterium sp.]
MSNKEFIIKFAAVLIIFCVGFFFRIDSANLPGVPDNEKSFFEDQNNLLYMYDMDSYYNYRLTKNYIEHGYLGDKVVDNKEWDLHSYYPPGVPLDYPPLIVYITTLIYKIVNLFAAIPLLTVCFWLPAFIAPICGVLAYLIVSRLTNDYGGIAAGILAVTSSLYFVRSVPGWFDTDMFNVLFPLLIILFFFEAFKSENIKKNMVFACLSAFSMFLFATAWNGWQYLFYIISLFCIFYMIWSKIKGKNIKKIAYISGIFIFGSIFLICIFTGFLNIIKLVFGVLEFVKLAGNQGVWGPWPDIYIFITELQPPSIKAAIGGLGYLLSGISIFGIFLIFRILINDKLKEHFLKKMSWFFYLFLLFWTITGIFALTEGFRFIILLIPPLVIISGITVGIITEFFDQFNKKNLNKLLSLSFIIIICAFSFLAIYDASTNLVPRMNDDLWDSALWINNDTSNDTVIISSWVYGHFFAAIADRPVVLDGRLGYVETLPIREFDSAYSYKNLSPSTSREYWIDKALSTNNESLSLGIFRMLATSGDLAYLTLYNYTENSTKSIEILNIILGQNKELAMKTLTHNYHLNQKIAANIIEYTHPNNPVPFVLVTCDKMIDDGWWIFSFGEWDFENKQPGDPIYSFGEIIKDNNTLKTSDGINIDLNTYTAEWNGVKPYCVTIIENNKTKTYYLDKNSKFCVILNIDNGNSVVLDKQFEKSLFTKLVIEKRNSTNFKPIYSNKHVTIWKTNG